MFQGQGQGYATSVEEGIRRAIWEAFRQVFFGAIVPFALFYQARERVSLTAAIIATTLWSIGVILHTWRTRRRFDMLTAGSLFFLFFTAAVGIVSQDATLYLALPVIEQSCLTLALVGSVAIRRPIFGLLAAQFSNVAPDIAGHTTWRRAFNVVTLLWAAGTIIRMAIRLGLLYTAGVDLFLILYPIASWTLSAGLMIFTFWYPQRLFRRHPLASELAATTALAPAPAAPAAPATDG